MDDSLHILQVHVALGDIIDELVVDGVGYEGLEEIYEELLDEV